MPNALLNVIDVEATCWEGAPPSGQVSEIIEIGLCVLDLETRTLAERRSIIVRPSRSQVSGFCTALTGWTQETVEGGAGFAEACRILERDFSGRARTWSSWGDYDRKQFNTQCAATNTVFPLSRNHINAKKRYAEAFGLKKKPGMTEALAHARIPLEGRHHRGVDDAANIAKLIARLIEVGAWEI